MDEICTVIGKVFEKIYRNGLNPTDKIVTRYFDADFDDSNTDLEVCIPVNKFIEKENDYETIAPPFDRYIKGGESTQYPDEFVTEVYFPVRKKA